VKIERFEDTKAWKEARVLAKMTYTALDSDQRLCSHQKFEGRNELKQLKELNKLKELGV
jgi:hypothetical protein